VKLYDIYSPYHSIYPLFSTNSTNLRDLIKHNKLIDPQLQPLCNKFNAKKLAIIST